MANPPPDEQTLNQTYVPPLDGPSLEPGPAERLARVRLEQQRFRSDNPDAARDRCLDGGRRGIQVTPFLRCSPRRAHLR